MICTPFILVFGLITAPLSLIFGWRGFYTLYIANQESCSFLKAKEILAKGDKYKNFSNKSKTFNNSSGNGGTYFAVFKVHPGLPIQF